MTFPVRSAFKQINASDRDGQNCMASHCSDARIFVVGELQSSRKPTRKEPSCLIATCLSCS